MDDLPALALELLEYKVDDLRHRRPVRGGTESVHRLRRALDEIVHRLTPEQRERFRAVAREIGGQDGAPVPGRSASATFNELVLSGERSPEADGGVSGTEIVPDDPDDAADLVLLLEDAETPEPAPPTQPLSEPERREQEALQRLAQQRFERQIDRFTLRVAAGWRAERERITPRLLYATLRNLDRYRETPAYANDANLRQFRVTEPIPARVDPLVSLSDVDNLAVVGREFIEAVVHLKDGPKPPPIERAESLDYVKRVAFQVASDPYAGETSAVAARGPDASELRSALRDLTRQRLPDWQRQARREDLEARLREREAIERQQRTILRRDTLRFAEHLDAYFAQLASLLPASLGGRADEPRLDGGVLFAVTPGLRRTEVPPEERSLTMRLAGPVRLTFAGRPLVVTGDGTERRLFLGDQELPIGEGSTTMVNGEEIDVLSDGPYLHLHLRDVSGSFAAAVAEAALCLHVLASRDALEATAMLRLLAPGSPGDLAGLVAAAARRSGQIVAKAPDRTEAMRRLVLGAGRAIGFTPDPDWTEGFVRRALLAANARPEQLPEAIRWLAEVDEDADPPTVVPFSGDPVDVPVGGRTVTVRQYGARGADHLVAMVPGHVIGAFQRQLLEPLGPGTFLCVHGDQQLALAYLPNLPLSERRDVARPA